jgi:hypothetical protein
MLDRSRTEHHRCNTAHRKRSPSQRLVSTICFLGKCDPRKGQVEINREKRGVLALGRALCRKGREDDRQFVEQFGASCIRFGEGRERAIKHATGWLCWQAAANCSPSVRFPDHWENTGNLSMSSPSRTLGPLDHNRLAVEFPKGKNRQFSLRNRERRIFKWEIPNVRIYSKSGPSELEGRRLLSKHLR